MTGKAVMMMFPRLGPEMMSGRVKAVSRQLEPCRIGQRIVAIARWIDPASQIDRPRPCLRPVPPAQIFTLLRKRCEEIRAWRIGRKAGAHIPRMSPARIEIRRWQKVMPDDEMRMGIVSGARGVTRVA